MNDAVSTAHMTQGAKTRFTADRFGCANQALDLNGGYTQVPSGVYFETPQFSISLWIYPMNVGSWARVIDFGTNGINNIALAIKDSTNGGPILQIFYSQLSCFFFCRFVLESTLPLVTSEWQLLTVTFDDSYFKMYINASLTANIAKPNSFQMENKYRNTNYMGRSNAILNGDGVSFSYIDDIRFYSTSLSQSEIMSLMTENDTLLASTLANQYGVTLDFTHTITENATFFSDDLTSKIGSTTLTPITKNRNINSGSVLCRYLSAFKSIMESAIDFKYGI